LNYSSLHDREPSGILDGLKRPFFCPFQSNRVMPIDIARYHGWQGTRGTPWRGVVAMVRVGLVQVFRRKAYWVVLALGLLQFLAFWAVIWAVTQLKELPDEARNGMLEGFGFTASPREGKENGYSMFIERQSVVVMILLTFTGSLLVGGDFRNGALAFYLSRSIDRRHYIIGKLVTVGMLISLLTTLPALLLFAEYGMFTSSFDYWFTHWRIPLGLLFYGAVLSVVLSILLVTLSAYLQRMAPIAITWASLFVLLRILRALMRGQGIYWNLIDPWRDMHFVGRLAFDQFRNNDERHFAHCAAGLLTVVCALALMALVRRVRAVEVVE
jgi:ABC-type transport system involved in multi-copper enzyme maturation permease subunit